MRFAGRPTLQTIVLVVLVFLVQQLLQPLEPLAYALFVLDPAVGARPWTLVTSVYAHATISHLLSNVIALAIVGPLVARRTTPLRFHGYFVSTGALAGVAEVGLGGIVGPPTGVVGASGAIFALLGYLLAGNVVVAGMLRRINLSKRQQALLFLGIAILVTLATGTPRAALIGHGVGLLLGLVAGRVGLLDVRSGSRAVGSEPRSG